jgi:tetrahydrodipicolinate N-succinyltransferase
MVVGSWEGVIVGDGVGGTGVSAGCGVFVGSDVLVGFGVFVGRGVSVGLGSKGVSVGRAASVAWATALAVLVDLYDGDELVIRLNPRQARHANTKTPPMIRNRVRFFITVTSSCAK